MPENTADTILNCSDNSNRSARHLSRLIITVFISIYFYIFLPVSLFSQPDSLLSYLTIAARNNPLVMQRYSEYQAALQKIPQAGAIPDPELSAGVFLKPMELMNGNQIADLRIMQMFPWFGVLRSAKDEMSLMANAKYDLFRDAKLQLYLDVQRAWYELYETDREIRISLGNIEILKTIEKLALGQFSSETGEAGTSSSKPLLPSSSTSTNSPGTGMQGMNAGESNTASVPGSKTAPGMESGTMNSTGNGSGLADYYGIQMEKGELENNIEFLKSRKNTLLARFNSYLNRAPSSPAFIPDRILPDSSSVQLTAISDSMLSNNPMLGMIDYERQAIEARKKMVTRMGYPMIGVGLNYSVIGKLDYSGSSMNGKDMVMPMVSVTLPIYRKKYRAMQAEAGFMNEAASLNFDQTSNSLKNEYFEAVQQYDDAKRRIALYSNQYDLSIKTRDLTLKSYIASSATLSDVLRVNQLALKYEIEEVKAISDFNTAVAWLKRLASLETNMKNQNK